MDSTDALGCAWTAAMVVLIVAVSSAPWVFAWWAVTTIAEALQ